MKIPAWELREASVATPETLTDWLLQQPLAATDDSQSSRSTIGPDNSALLIVSNAPADQRGDTRSMQLVSGAAAKLLDAMLKAIDQSRQSCRLASLVAPGLLGGLMEETNVSQLLVRMPPTAVLFFTRPEDWHGAEDFASVKGRVYQLGQSGIKCVVSYHPDYLLLHPDLKRQAWEDLKQVRNLLNSDPDIDSESNDI